MTLYMAVTSDKYELPLYVTEYPKEMAEKFNISRTNMLSLISHKTSGLKKGYRFLRVQVEDDEEE